MWMLNVDKTLRIECSQCSFGVVDCNITDTIPGRQCMASCFFLMRQFEDVLIYLNSIRVISVTDAHFMLALLLSYG